MYASDLHALLRGNSYPGRGILLGRSADNRYAVAAYFIMGRSENSRNRVFVTTEDGIRTQAHDPGKVTDPSLILYHPVRAVRVPGGTALVVTNGDQTDTIRDALCRGERFESALRTRTFEPDGPHYTPRVSGLMAPDGSYQLSILKACGGDPACCCRFFYEYDRPLAGVGHLIHTYEGDGSPLPSFQGEPRAVALSGDLPSFAQGLWDSLNEQNRVSLYVRYTDLASGAVSDRIHNRNL